MTLSSIPLARRPDLVRQECDALGVDGFILPRGDEYLGEYVPPSAERLAWLTGFTGSAGLAILLAEKACVFSDGRYTVQMEEQVPASLWERRHILTAPPRQWLSEQAKGLRLGYDPHLVSPTMLQSWQTPEVTFLPLPRNPVDSVWHDRPAPPAGKIYRHPLAFSGEESADKRARLAQKLRSAGQDAMILADCTSLAWLLNIRGEDVPMTPLPHGYGILHDDGIVEYFVDSARLTETLEKEILLQAPSSLPTRLRALKGKTVRLDPVTTPVWFSIVLEEAGAIIVQGEDVCTLPKSVKNPVEQEGSRRAHALDAVALTRFLHFVDRSGVGKRETELSAHLNALRARSEFYRGESFEAISAVGPNGAYPHYRALPGQDAILEPDSVYLIDSGGQYPFGTTDITRTLWVSEKEPPQDLRDAFTRVLKGNIALSRLRFPARTPGYRLDVLARASLWEAGLDYDHGTGHGIGNYLSVHEGPQSISSAPRPVALEPGMILSNEPGYYAQGQYGIRIENLLLVKESAVQGKNGPFLEFEVLSFAPIDRRLIDVSLLTDEERRWLNAYHAEVENRVGPSLEEAERDWLKRACAPIRH